MIVLDALLLHESLDRWVLVPLLAFVLISSNVDICVREKRRHLTKKRIEKLVNLFARGIERRLKNSRAAFNCVGTGCTAELRVTDQPAGAVTGYVKLRNDTDAALASVINELPYLFLAVVETIRSHLMKLGEFLTLNPKALIL